MQTETKRKSTTTKLIEKIKKNPKNQTKQNKTKQNKRKTMKTNKNTNVTSQKFLTESKDQMASS